MKSVFIEVWSDGEEFERSIDRELRDIGKAGGSIISVEHGVEYDLDGGRYYHALIIWKPAQTD